MTLSEPIFAVAAYTTVEAAWSYSSGLRNVSADEAVVEATRFTSMLEVFTVDPIITYVPAAREAGTAVDRVTVVVPAVVADALSVPLAAPRVTPEQA